MTLNAEHYVVAISSVRLRRARSAHRVEPDGLSAIRVIVAPLSAAWARETPHRRVSAPVLVPVVQAMPHVCARFRVRFSASDTARHLTGAGSVLHDTTGQDRPCWLSVVQRIVNG